MRALIVRDDRLLLVNAWPGRGSDLWCAPGGGVVPGAGLPDNLRREVHEELGLTIEVGKVCLVNEFHDPASGFHQVELFFRCSVVGGDLTAAWRDPEGIVDRWILAGRRDLERRVLRYKPDALPGIAWSGAVDARYDPLETLVR